MCLLQLIQTSLQLDYEQEGVGSQFLTILSNLKNLDDKSIQTFFNDFFASTEYKETMESFSSNLGEEGLERPLKAMLLKFCTFSRKVKNFEVTKDFMEWRVGEMWSTWKDLQEEEDWQWEISCGDGGAANSKKRKLSV